jgi:predicted nucleic acid-binding protein
VGSNVLIDIATNDAACGAWSASIVERIAGYSVLVINALIYAEVSVGLPAIELVDDILPVDAYRRDELPYEAAFLAGKVFRQYRRRGGVRRSPLPDFYIGAHAAVDGFPLLTRDEGPYRTYFPRLEIISPAST